MKRIITKTNAVLSGAAFGLFAADSAQAQEFECDALIGEPVSCEVTRFDSVVCTPSGPSGAVEISDIAACVDREFGTGVNPIVTVAAFGGPSGTTEQYDGWNGGTAFTSHKLEELQEELDGEPLFYEVAQPMLALSRGGAYPGQATLVTTVPVNGIEEARQLNGANTILVAGGGGAHGQVYPGSSSANTGRGGYGGYADGWEGIPCPYTADAVCADGTDGQSTRGARGGLGGTEEQDSDFVECLENGVEDAIDGRYAWGGHGGAGHPQGGGGEANESVRPVAAAGGGGGGSLAWRSSRPTPPGLERVLIEEPGVQLIFESDGAHSELEWQYADFSGDGFDAYEMKGIDGNTTISITINDPSGVKTDLELGGLTLVDQCGSDGQRVEPYRVTDLVQAGGELVATEATEVFYRVYDGDGEITGTGRTKATASFVENESLHLHFRYTDGNDDRGRIAVYDDSGGPGLPGLCDR